MKTMLALAAAGLLAAAPAAAQAPSGESLFKQRCSACHTIEAGGAAKLGPPLRGVVGRAAGAVPGFAYSSALKQSGATWDKSTLDAYLARPAAKFPGTKMLVGVPAADQRAAIILYLASKK